MSVIWEAIQEAVGSFMETLSSLFNGIADLFIDSSGTTPTPTFLGNMMFIALGCGLVWVAFAVIRKLVRGSTK